MAFISFIDYISLASHNSRFSSFQHNLTTNAHWSMLDQSLSWPANDSLSVLVFDSLLLQYLPCTHPHRRPLRVSVGVSVVMLSIAAAQKFGASKSSATCASEPFHVLVVKSAA